MTEVHREQAIQGKISIISELEGLKIERISTDTFERQVIEHLIVDLREQRAVKPQAKP